ncbi:MAG: hypothetical protein AAFU41_18900 [Pseudomonadota bacterium]
MHRLIPAAIMATLASTASAQDAYVGGSLDYNLPHSGDAQTAGSVIAGLGFDLGTFGVGAEVEYGLRIAGDNDYDMARVGGWASYDWADYTLIAGGGITEYYFEDSNSGGFNFSIGAERDLTDRVSVRGQIIRDFLDNAFTKAVTTTRLAVAYNF